MTVSEKGRENTRNFRSMIAMGGVAKILGVSRGTVYRRITMGLITLEGIPQADTVVGRVYDLEAVFQKVYPGADGNGIAVMMQDFTQKYGRLIR